MAVLDPMPQQAPLTSGTPAVLSSTGEVVQGGSPTAQPQYMSGSWLQWFYNAITNRLGLCAFREGSAVALTNRTGAIALTTIAGTTGGGRQRVNWYLRVNTGDAASTLQLQITWTEGGSVLNLLTTQLNPPAAGNVLAGSALLETQSSAPVSYSVLYSHPGGPLVYRLSIVVEAMP